MNKPPLVNTKTLTNNVSLQIVAGKIAEAQRDADWGHEQQMVRGIFEEIEKRYFLIDREEPRASGLIALPVSWQSFKEKYL